MNCRGLTTHPWWPIELQKKQLQIASTLPMLRSEHRECKCPEKNVKKKQEKKIYKIKQNLSGKKILSLRVNT